MSKKRVSSPGRRKARSPRSTSSNKANIRAGQVGRLKSKDRPELDELAEGFSATNTLYKYSRFVGVSLSGGKNDKTWVSLLDYFPQQNKIFLKQLENISVEEPKSTDTKLIELVTDQPKKISKIGFDVALSFPLCIGCNLKCPGVEACNEPHIKWLWNNLRSQKKSRSKPKLFTPYTERSVEKWLTDSFPDIPPVQSALGANMAPLTARAQFLMKRLRPHLKKVSIIEVVPNASYWRIGKYLGMTKQQLTFHKHSFHGAETRLAFLKLLIQKTPIFLYQQDLVRLHEAPGAFDSFVVALTVYLESLGQAETKPLDFPKKEAWISVPKQNFKL